MEKLSSQLRFFLEEKINGEDILYIYYSSPTTWPFSLLVLVDLTNKSIKQIFSGRDPKGRSAISSFLIKIIDLQKNNLRKLNLNSDRESNYIHDVYDICSAYKSEDLQQQNNIELMKKHIETALYDSNIIYNAEASPSTIVNNLTSILNRSKKCDKSHLCFGLCDDIDNMRLKGHFGLNFIDEHKIYGLICISFKHAQEVLKLLKIKGYNVIEYEKNEIPKTNLIFITRI